MDSKETPQESAEASTPKAEPSYLSGTPPKEETTKVNADASDPKVESSNHQPNVNPAESAAPVETTVGLRVAWPPELVSSTPLGAIRDGRGSPMLPLTKSDNTLPIASGNSYPRDIGRSSELGGRVFFQFGDTFCHNSDGKFIGLTNNTAALLLDKSNPALTKYAGSTEERIPDFIKLLNDEQNGSGSLGHSIWSFSDTVEYQKQDHYVDGWTWYQMRIRYPHDLPTDEPKVAYIGIARVSYHTRHRTLTTLRDKEVPALFEVSKMAVAFKLNTANYYEEGRPSAGRLLRCGRF
jgi:hypothetical protein